MIFEPKKQVTPNIFVPLFVKAPTHLWGQTTEFRKVISFTSTHEEYNRILDIRFEAYPGATFHYEF